MTKKVLALGYFDSIHIGHRKLLYEALTYAKSIKASLTVATFDDNFLKSVRKNEKEVFLLEERKMILHSLGATDILVFPSDKTFLSLDKEDFCRYINGLDFCAVFVGSDYRFGKNAEGSVDYLRMNCSSEVHEIDLVRIQGKKVSSSNIRFLLSLGKVDEVILLLTEPYFIMGKVTEGRKAGRKINFPTLNLISSENKELPMYGVYVTETEIEGKRYLSVTNVGPHPTFADDKINIESHVIDFDGEIYNQNVTIYFYKYVREIVKFDEITCLKEQITKDISIAKEYYYDKIRRGRQQ